MLETAVPVLITMLKDCGADFVKFASSTCTEKFAVVFRIGMPEIMPVAAFNFRPEGSWPPTMLQMYGVTPPFATRVPV